MRGHRRAVALLLDPKNTDGQRGHHPRGHDRPRRSTTKLSKATKIPVADFEAAGEGPGRARRARRSGSTARDGKTAADQVDRGLPLPGHLRVRRRSRPPSRSSTMMVTQFLDGHRGHELRRHGAEHAAASRPYEALIVASLAQAEAGNKDDFAKVARVLYNRAYSGRFPCACLEMDSDGQLLAAAARQDGEGVRAPDRRPSSRPERTRTTRTTSPACRRPDQQPGQGGAGGRDGPGRAATGFYFVTIDKKGTTALRARPTPSSRRALQARRAHNGVAD